MQDRERGLRLLEEAAMEGSREAKESLARRCGPEDPQADPPPPRAREGAAPPPQLGRAGRPEGRGPALEFRR